MSQGFFNPFEPSQAFLAPLVKTHQLAVANLEKLATFQINLLQSYVDLGLTALQTAAQVRDPESLQAFYTSQLEAAATLPQKWMEDTQTLCTLKAGFQSDFNTQARATAEEWTAEVAKTAQKTDHKTAYKEVYKAA